MFRCQGIHGGFISAAWGSTVGGGVVICEGIEHIGHLGSAPAHGVGGGDGERGRDISEG